MVSVVRKDLVLVKFLGAGRLTAIMILGRLSYRCTVLVFL